MEENMLLETIEKQNVEILKRLLNEKPELNVCDSGGWKVPLHEACKKGNMTIIKLLVEHGADVRYRDHWGVPPISRAAQYDQNQVMEYLILCGTDINEQDDEGDPPIHFAMYSQSLKSVECLLKHGADLALLSAVNKPILEQLKKEENKQKMLPIFLKYMETYDEAIQRELKSMRMETLFK